MRLGGPVFDSFENPAEWVEAHRKAGYAAAYLPADHCRDEESAAAWAKQATAAGLVIAEVGAWSNPLAPESKQRSEAVELCKARLALADAAGARCCVNIAGSRGGQWDGPHEANLTQETFGMLVDTVRDILDTVQPLRTYYTLETMPWMYPDSADSYLALIGAIGRERFAVHLDPVNMVCSPQRYYGNAALIRECFEKLGPHIRSCHAKDIVLHPQLTTHLDETAPGKGGLDYAVYLRQLDRLDPDTPLMLEHLTTADAYAEAAAWVRDVAAENGVAMVTLP